MGHIINCIDIIVVIIYMVGELVLELRVNDNGLGRPEGINVHDCSGVLIH